MNESNIFVKEKQPDLLTKGFILLALIVASLICCFTPLLFNGLESGKVAFYLIGGILFALFVALFARLLYKEFRPDDAIIISSRGFVDKKNVGSDIEIEWTNVASVKLMGSKDMPFLGITLDNSDIVMAKMNKREADEMRENIDENLPHILIAQNEVYTPVNELKDTFVRFIREARVLSNEPNQKSKNNPFTTEDVLRAFGKLPTTEEEQTETSNTDADAKSDTVVDTVDMNDVYSQEEEPSIDENSSDEVHNNEDDSEINTDDLNLNSLDSFYNSLQNNLSSTGNNDEVSDESEATVSTETEVKQSEESTNIVSDPDLSDEINEILSRAKGSKIAELNKLLNEKDVPFSTSRDEQVSKESKSDEKTVEIENVLEDKNDILTILAESNNISKQTLDLNIEQQETPNSSDSVDDVNYNNDFYIELPSELYDNANISDLDITFETLIQETTVIDEIEISNNESDTNKE